MISAAYDENGYLYDTASGNYLSVDYDSAGNAFESYSGEPVVIVADYTSGNPGYDHSGIAQTISDTLVGIFGGGQRGYYAPSRNQQGQYGRDGYYPQQTNSGVRVGGSLTPGGIGAGFQVSPMILLIGGLVVGAFVFGKKGR